MCVYSQQPIFYFTIKQNCNNKYTYLSFFLPFILFEEHMYLEHLNYFLLIGILIISNLYLQVLINKYKFSKFLSNPSVMIDNELSLPNLQCFISYTTDI